MKKEETVYMWPGQFSNSELALRVGRSFAKNPVGIGGKPSVPANWNPKAANTPNYKEFAKYNCTSIEVFRIRLSLKGWPVRSFIRCQRIAWFLANSWYKAEYVDRMHLLNKWPPP